MKLNLRDLFWLILVAAVATMWWIDRGRLATELAIYKAPRPTISGLPAIQFGGIRSRLDEVELERAVLADKIQRELERSPGHSK